MAHIDKKIEILGTSFICDEFYEIKLKHNKKQEVVFRAVQISRDRLEIDFLMCNQELYLQMENLYVCRCF